MPVVRFSRADRRWPAVGALPLALLLTWAVLVGVFMLLKPDGSDATLCVFRNVTGVPCPTCGSTRAALAAVHGRPLDALMLNPFVTVAVIVTAACLVVRIGFARRIELDLAPRQAAMAWVVFVALLGANWVFVIQGHT